MGTLRQTWVCVALLLTASVAINAQTSTATPSTATQTSPTVIAAPTAPATVAETSAKSSTPKGSSSSKPAAVTTASDLIAATTQTKVSTESLLKRQEAEIATATTKLEELRKLVADGLVARVELENEEALLAGLRRNLETLQENIANADRTIVELRKAEELAKVQPLIPTATRTSSRSFLKPTILRYNPGMSWSLANIGHVQAFFVSTFGQSLPTSAVGQSATHNRLGYDHRNAVDVALHPDSFQGKALISFLQSQGIPFLAFRSAVPGVATGPHIHIGNPSHRLG